MGNREQIEGANTKISANEWHTLSLKAEGERFTVAFNGKPSLHPFNNEVDTVAMR